MKQMIALLLLALTPHLTTAKEFHVGESFAVTGDRAYPNEQDVQKQMLIRGMQELQQGKKKVIKNDPGPGTNPPDKQPGEDNTGAIGKLP